MMTKEKEEVFLGHLAKPFGIKGELKLVPSRDFWEGALESKELVLRLLGDEGVDVLPFKLTSFRRKKDNYILKAEGVGDRTSAEALIGGEIFISSSAPDVEPPDGPRPFQIVGSAVISEDGRPLGEVTSVLFTPVHDVYEVAGDKETFLVPAVPEFILSIDAEKGEIVIRPIPGLIGEQ